MDDKEFTELRKVLAQKHAGYQASLVCHLKVLLESGPSEMHISIEIQRFRESSAEWEEISKIEKDLKRTMRTRVFGNVGTCQTNRITNQ